MNIDFQLLQSESADGLTAQVVEAESQGWKRCGSVFSVKGLTVVGGGDGSALRWLPCDHFAVEMERGEDAKYFYLRELEIVFNAKPLTKRQQRRRLRELGVISLVPRPSDWR